MRSRSIGESKSLVNRKESSEEDRRPEETRRIGGVGLARQPDSADHRLGRPVVLEGAQFSGERYQDHRFQRPPRPEPAERAESTSQQVATVVRIRWDAAIAETVFE